MDMLSKLLKRLEGALRILPSGAKSLAHVGVIVPTVQASRRLRQALAEKFGALVPPEVMTPQSARLDPNDPTLATRTEMISAFDEVLRTPEERALNRAKTLADLRLLLEPKALTFAAVAQKLESIRPEEYVRWKRLTEIENAYFAVLERKGKRDRLAVLADPAVRHPIDACETVIDCARLLEESVEGRPEIPRDRIVPTSTPADEAARLADYFASVRETEAYPALTVVDAELFPEIESAFKARGLKLHNPAETPLASSTLGHLVDQIVSLLRSPAYIVFSAFVRGGDVRRWLKRELKLSEEDLTAALVDLDNRQARFLPELIDDIAPHTQGALRAIFEFVKVQLRKKGLRQILGSIFEDVVLNERDAASREFAAAAEVVSGLIAECGDDFDLLALRLKEATYSLEPDEGDVILTDGWLDIPFLPSGELVIAGFCEGCVPESTVGHPYLPDSLRHELGLEDNAAKERRDRAILADALGARQADRLTIFFHSVSAAGDVLKPSRLLFETSDDEDLYRRVESFYELKAGTNEGSAADLPAKWKLDLPIPPEHCELTKMSPTRFDSYRNCPFTYYLKDKEILGEMRLDDRAEELAAWEYGNLAHEALEEFGLSDLRDSTDESAIREFLEEQVDRQLVERFGTAIPAVVAMQGESVKRRLAHFAAEQVVRRKEGWKIVAVERRMEVTYGHTRFNGKCDRIDRNEFNGKWCVIDYKTWDTKDRKVKKGEEPLQLPLYCAMLDVSQDADLADAKRADISAAYFVLGKTRENVGLTEEHVGITRNANGDMLPGLEDEIRKTIARIEAGIFWPPNDVPAWKYDYEDWLSPSPQEAVNEEWIADQLRRLEKAEEVRGEHS